MKRSLYLLFFILASLIAGCSYISGGDGRYSMKHDKAPAKPVDLSHVKDAVPRVEPKSRGGNKSPYKVFGKKYYVMSSAAGYKATGTASWYGRKFHGHKTSNGEVYDMYEMTAAHKALPLPTYLRVTNLANNKQVIVRVNDRGPFHGNRLIDLSYAAAYKLDMLKKGTANVRLEAIDPRTWSKGNAPAAPVRTVTYTQPQGQFLQVGAYSNKDSAMTVKSRLQQGISHVPALLREGLMPNGRTIYRVQLGPLNGKVSVNQLINQVEQMGYSNPRLVD